MQCQKCKYEPTLSEIQASPDRCPRCGKSYAGLGAASGETTSTAQLSLSGAGSKSGRGIWKIVAIIGSVAAVLYIAAAPYITVYQIRQAAEDRDAEGLSEHIDFPSVRQSLKDQMNAKVMASTSEDLKDNPFAAFGAALAGAMVDKMVDAYVTPAGITQMMKGEKPVGGKARENVSAETTGSGHQADKKPFDNASMTYEGLSKFVVEVKDGSKEPVRFILRRDGISWKLSEIGLPLDS